MPQGSRTPVAVFVAVSSYAVAFAVFVASASVLVAWTYWSNFRRKAGLRGTPYSLKRAAWSRSSRTKSKTLVSTTTPFSLSLAWLSGYVWIRVTERTRKRLGRLLVTP